VGPDLSLIRVEVFGIAGYGCAKSEIISDCQWFLILDFISKITVFQSTVMRI
jgi:hypothetical protein